MSARKCVMLMAMLACAGGAWGVDWNDDFETQDVTGTETIVLTKDITVTNLWIHTENQAATINLNGHTLTVTKFYLGGIENEANDEVPTTNAILKLIDTSETPGTLKITRVLDVANDKNTQLKLANGVSVKVTGTYWLNVNDDVTNSPSISGNGIFDVSEGTNGTVGATWIPADKKVYVDDVVSETTVSVVDSGTSCVSTDTYYWTGTAGDKNWFTSTNWAANTAGTPVEDGTYPGKTTNNKAIFTGSAEVNLNGSITDLTSINTSDSTVTIVSSSSGISLGSASVTFTGNFAFKGSFTASSLATYFLNGNVDFSECSAFNANSGTVYFFSSSEKILTTFSGQTFNNLRFGGNVTITSKITGGSVSVTGELQISRVSSTDEVIGTLELNNTDLSSSTVTIYSGTELSLTSSSQLTSNSIQQQAADASYPNAIHNDGIITVTGTSASSLSIFGASEASRFTVDGSGRFVVSGGTSAFTGTYLSIGGNIKISDNSSTVAANTFGTTDNVPATGVTYAQIMANGWKVSSGIFKWTGASSSDWNEKANWVEIIGESTTIAATIPPNSKKHEVTIPSGLSVWPIATESIELNTLSVEDGAQLTLGNSSSTSSLKLYGDSSSQLSIEGKLIFSGTTSLECESLEKMTFKDLQFGSSSGDTSAAFTTGVNMVISDGGSWVNYSGSGGFIPNGKSVTFTGSASLSGTTTFADLSFTGSGKTVSFDSDSLINVGGKLTVQGEENNEITFGGDSEWKINPDTSNLSVSHAVIKNSKNTNSSPIVVKAAENTNGGGNTNWIFIGYEYEWTGSSSTDPTDWYTAENWNPQMVPEKYSKITIPQVTSENYPLISKATDLGSGSLVYDGVTYTSSISVAENASFDFNGKKLTVNTLKSDGRMRLLGTEDLTGITNYPLDGSYITGTVEFYGTNLTITDATSGGNFTNLEFTGSGISIKGNFVAKNNILVKTNLTFKGNASFTAANGIEFNSDTALSINRSGTSAYSATFNSPVTANCDLSFTLSSVNFSDSASFSHDSTKSITINSPTAFNFGKAAFNAGKLIIASGASFKQTGINQASDSSELLQTVGDIVNDGSCIWDSSSLGGSLSLNGDLSGTKAAEILFNKKNVTLVKSPVSISGVFYDLTIPDSVEATNSSQICVRRNLSVIGSYIHNDKNLVLGAVTVNGTTYESGENDGVAAGEIYSPSSNLGSVIINQNETGKKFTSEINALSLSMDCILSDSSKTGGSIEFAEKITAESFTNAAATNFALLFDKACSFTNALSPAAFSTTGNLVLGTAEESSCTFASALSHTTGETILAGSLSALSAEFARIFLSKNTVIDCESGSVTFNGLLDSQFSDSHASIQIGSETSATEAHFAASLGSVNPLLSLTVWGNAEFASSAISDGVITLNRNVLSSASGVSLASLSSYIIAGGSADRSWAVNDSCSLALKSDVFLDMASSASLSFESGMDFEKSLVFYSGKFSANAGSLNIQADAVFFGSAYSSDDRQFSGEDSRFAYFPYIDSVSPLSYRPSGGESAFAAEISSPGLRLTVAKNLYANGLDISDCSFVLPDNSASSPVFNSSAFVTEKQWGLPYAVIFNSKITNSSASASSGSAIVAAAKNQGCEDGSGNTGFQFALPLLAEAYSVSDEVICLSFDMTLENSNGEVVASAARISSLSEGGIFYNGGNLAFDGIFYTETDGTYCSVPLSETAYASSDIPAATKLYLKASSEETKWNTDANASSAGNEDSTDRSGVHHDITTDLSFLQGLFYGAEGKTMCRNYGIGLWKASDSSYSSSESYPTVDKARPVLIDLLAGQELHTTSTGSAESQKPYDSHNFIELRYSEPVDIGDLPSGATSDNQNIQTQESFESASSHGGAIIPDGSALTLAGFAQIASGSLTAGYRNGSDHDYDRAKAHSLYRKFSRYAAASEEVQPCRIRISVAGFVDEANPVVIDGKSFNNWIGFIDSSESPSGLVQPLANSFITDLATDNDGTALKNVFDEINASRTISVNEPSPSMLSDSHSVPGSESSLYGDWDCSHPVFAPYITSYNGSDSCSWNDGDSDTRSYELIGMVASNSDAYLDHVEFHLFDNAQRYSSSDTYKWISQIGWTENGSEIKTIVHSAPEHSGGEKQFSMTQNRTLGGIRRSSLADALAAFEYSYTLDEETSETRSFGGTEVSQKVKSLLFRNKDLTITSTDNDGLYLTLQLNDKDNALPIGTGFTVTYYPDKSFITDLAGNRLLQTDGGSKKTLHSVDITPPSFSVVLSPIGEKKIYAVFTKPLAYGGTLLQDRSDLSSVLEKIRANLEFVYSLDDDIDTDDEVSGEDAISIEKVELSSYSSNYTSLIFTLDRSIRLNDVEKIWIRVNDECEEVETFSGTIKASYFRDISENALPYHTCHAISDFAINAVNVLYGYSVSDQDEGWDEQGIYGTGVNSLSSDYAVHDFSEKGGNYARLRSGHDIIFQLQLVGGVDSDGYYAFQNGESLALVIDKKTNLRTEWISDKFNLLTGSDWRIWLDAKLYSIATDYNHNPLSGNPDFENVAGSDLLKNMTITNDDYKFTSKEEYQFFFKICDSSGSPIMINHDGDKTTPEIPLYAFRMPAEKISSGNFSFLDLWSFTISSITSQRGGVTILNNVIDASVGEKTAIEVDMQSSGSLNVFVMTIDGNIVQRLSKGSVSAGKHYFYWDGKNTAGNPVARGLYFVRVNGSGIDETRKVMVVK